jgi:hypothetical protein
LRVPAQLVGILPEKPRNRLWLRAFLALAGAGNSRLAPRLQYSLNDIKNRVTESSSSASLLFALAWSK